MGEGRTCVPVGFSSDGVNLRRGLSLTFRKKDGGRPSATEPLLFDGLLAYPSAENYA